MRWEEIHIEKRGECYAFCSECGESVDMDENERFPDVCPHCGKRMVKKDD